MRERPSWPTNIAENLLMRLRADGLAGIKTQPDPFDLAQRLGVEVAYEWVPSTSGRLRRVDKGWRIVVPSNGNVSRQRWACAHELGHFLLHAHYPEFGDTVREKMLESEANLQIEEMICNRFAQTYLLPKEQMLDYLDRFHRNIWTVMQIVDTYHCSLQSAAIRLSEIDSSMAFVLARSTRVIGQGPKLSVVWAASPQTVYLPVHKSVSPESCIWKAFAESRPMTAWEDRILDRLKGRYWVEAVPLSRSESSFACIHLAQENGASQTSLPVRIKPPRQRSGVFQLPLPIGVRSICTNSRTTILQRDFLNFFQDVASIVEED